MWYSVKSPHAKVQKCVDLIEKSQSNKYQQYSFELINKVQHHIKTIKQKPILYGQTPISKDAYSPDFIYSSLRKQCYDIEVNPTEAYRITGNPWQTEVSTPHPLITVCPTQVISYIANHHPTDACLGIVDIIATVIDKHNITDIHIINTTISFKQNQLEKYHLILDESSMSKLRYYIKLHAHMDPSKTQYPQDGALTIRFKTIELDLRIATLPTKNNEMISLRAFHPKNKIKSLSQLGFSKERIRNPTNDYEKNGLILITGATGAGKSTTLYSLLQSLNHRQVITIEDPIEQPIPNIQQTCVNNKKGYTLDVGLTSILRHNPDVIGIGEIRDANTAKIVLQAAYSGHLVIASLHTNSIETTLLRLQSLGCSPFLISYCLRGIISQELVTSKQQTIELKSNILLCNDPLIITDIEKELTAFIKHNKLITND